MEYSTETPKELKCLEAMLHSQHEYLQHQHESEQLRSEHFKMELDHKDRQEKRHMITTIAICATVFLTFALYFIAAYTTGG